MTVRRGRTTLREVAAATGLSTAAVSYALRGKQVSKETEERVRRAAAELGYEADPVARALAGGRTGMVGVLSGDLQDLWQQRFNAVFGRELLDADLQALFVDAGADPERQLALATQLRDQRADAVVVSALDPSADAWRALAETVPLISLGDALDGARTAGEILFDNRTGMDLALSHLHALGHRRVAVLTPTLPSTPDRPADVYAAEAGERLGLEATIVACAQSLDEATATARGVLTGARRPTAVFCLSDSIAYGVYAAARDLGLDVPGALAVVGYDDHPVSGLLTPPLTTLDWGLESIAHSAAKLVTAAVDGRRRRRVTVTPALRDRGSTAALR